MTASNITVPGYWKAPLQSRLCWRVALCVLAATLAIEVLILIPSYWAQEGRLLAQLEERARLALHNELQSRQAGDPLALQAAGLRAAAGTALVGGVFQGPDGGRLASFGEASEPSVASSRRHEASWDLMVADAPLHVEARLDRASVDGELLAYTGRIAGLVLLICVVVFSVTMAALGRFVLQPIFDIRARMGPEADPQDPSAARPKDELEEVSSSLSSLGQRVAQRFTHKLEEHERRLQDFADAASDFFWEMDGDLRFSFFSDRFTTITGVPQDALLGRTREETGIPNVDPAAWRDHLSALAAHRPFRNFVHPRVLPDGRTVWISLNGSPVFDRNGAFRGFRGCGCDVTAQKLAEEALVAAKVEAEEARANLVEAIEAMSEGFALFDADDRLIVCNSKYREVFSRCAGAARPGLDYREILTAGIENGVFEEALGREQDWLESHLALARRSGTAFEERLSNGRWVRNTMRRTRAGGMVRTKTDISELKRREQELTEAKQQAEQASQAKSEFLANMSHELRTPLNAVIGFSEIILNSTMGPVGNAKYVEYAEDINKSGHHLLNLINEILDLSKIEAGKLDLNESFVDVKKAFQTCLAITSEPMAEAGLTLETDLPAHLPGLWADDLKLKQIVINLLSNALKFSDAGDVIRLSARIAPAGTFQFTVSDTGIGMSREEIPIALAPFGQVSKALDRKHAGTGLGLPLTKLLAERHGGSLCIESAPGVGTSVTVEFPESRVRSLRSQIAAERA